MPLVQKLSLTAIGIPSKGLDVPVYKTNEQHIIHLFKFLNYHYVIVSDSLLPVWLHYDEHI